MNKNLFLKITVSAILFLATVFELFFNSLSSMVRGSGRDDACGASGYGESCPKIVRTLLRSPTQDKLGKICAKPLPLFSHLAHHKAKHRQLFPNTRRPLHGGSGSGSESWGLR